jgi:ABC-type Mn2+/Zn2+ transport system permease subunit
MNIMVITLIGCLVAAASAYIGSFMVIKRMSLVGDALSHVALPGMAVAISFSLSPLLGALVALIVALFIIWYLQETTTIYTEGLVGVMFTFSLALGVILTKEPDLLEALFGNIESIKPTEAFFVSLMSISIMFVLHLISKKLIIGTISEDLSKSLKINTKFVNFIYLMLVGGIVAAGVMFVGTLLVGALVIIPAVSSKNIARNIKQYFGYSIIFGVVSTLAGVSLSYSTQISTGPLVVVASVVIFILTYLARLVFAIK